VRFSLVHGDGGWNGAAEATSSFCAACDKSVDGVCRYVSDTQMHVFHAVHSLFHLIVTRISRGVARVDESTSRMETQGPLIDALNDDFTTQRGEGGSSEAQHAFIRNFTRSHPNVASNPNPGHLTCDILSDNLIFSGSRCARNWFSARRRCSCVSRSSSTGLFVFNIWNGSLKPHATGSSCPSRKGNVRCPESS
jgi:hypothetical protein